MKIRITVLAVTALVVFAPAAEADNGRPTVHKSTAERQTRGFLVKNYPSWRYRAFGFVDCGRGKINRYTWACRVGWGRGHTCHRGRVRVTGAYREAHFNIFDVHLRGKGAYGCVGGG